MTWPFENDTSAITKKLANRSIKADKRRNIFIIVTIAFAACLMTVLALYTFGKSHELKTFLQGATKRQLLMWIWKQSMI